MKQLKSFKSLKEIKKTMQEADSLENFEAAENMLIFENKSLRLWVLSTLEKIYFVMDDKERIKPIYSNTKREFDYNILKRDRPLYGEILFSDAKKPLPFDKGLTGDTATFEAKLKTLLNV